MTRTEEHGMDVVDDAERDYAVTAGRRALSRRIVAPTREAIVELARSEGLELREGEADEILPTVAAIALAAGRADDLEAMVPRLRFPERDPGGAPDPQTDPYNSLIRACTIRGNDRGLLAGRTLGLKDNISVAGVPTTNASPLAPHTPAVDAVVAERILDAGATIVGKLNMDDMSSCGTGESSAYGPARNPVDPGRSAGGSSGGAGAAVRGGVVDLALGVDQGGSGRIPAAFCGVVGLKATHGLVPTFGVTHIDHTIDAVTPIGRTVADVALLLEAVAGDDWRDPQWVRGSIDVQPYSQMIDEGVAGLRIGVIRESTTDVTCEPAVLDGLAAARGALEDAGAIVEDASLPMWRSGFDIYSPYVAHLVRNMIRSEGEGYGHLGFIDVGRLHAFAAARRADSLAFPAQIKAWMLSARYLQEQYLNVPYAKLHNLRLLLRRRLTELLSGYDLLLTPTLPMTAPKLSTEPLSPGELLARTPAELAFNTCPLNLTGHPGLSVPSGEDATGLPTAVQVIGRAFEEATVLRAGVVLEERLGAVASP
jgi:amidase